jgi:hypothetical protein
MLCNLTFHNANEVRNSLVAQTVLILCNSLCKLSISTIHGQPVAQHAMLRNMIDREWAPLLRIVFSSRLKHYQSRIFGFYKELVPFSVAGHLESVCNVHGTQTTRQHEVCWREVITSPYALRTSLTITASCVHHLCREVCSGLSQHVTRRHSTVTLLAATAHAILRLLKYLN